MAPSEEAATVPDMIPGTTPEYNLWSSLSLLSTYDMGIFSCNCEESLSYGDAAFAAVTDYLDNGGRIFTTDFQYTWYKYSPDPNIGETSAGSPVTGLGSIAGGGFLQSINNTLTGLVDPTTGEVTDAQTSMTAEISQIGTQITTQQAQVALLQSNLTSQASAADALISSMEQTYSYLSDLFTSDTANEEENASA